MPDRLEALIAELQDGIGSVRNLVLMIAVPSCLAAIAGAVIGGLIAGSAMELRTARGIERFHQARTLLAANGIALEQGMGDLNAVLVIQRRGMIASSTGACPPGYPRDAFCIGIREEAKKLQ